MEKETTKAQVTQKQEQKGQTLTERIKSSPDKRQKQNNRAHGNLIHFNLTEIFVNQMSMNECM